MRRRFIFMAFMAMMGLADVFFVLYGEVHGTIGQYCRVLQGTGTGISGCESVLRSKYALTLGLPLTVWGILYWSSVLWLSILSMKRSGGLTVEPQTAVPSETTVAFSTGTQDSSIFELVLAILCFAGFLVSIRLIYIQAYVLKAWCPFCLFSAGLTVLCVWFACTGLGRPIMAVSWQPTRQKVMLVLVAANFILLAVVIPFLLFPSRDGSAGTGVASQGVMDRLLPAIPRRPVFPGGVRTGNTTAPVTVESFLDYTCGHCRMFEKQVMPILQREYIDAGKVMWIRKVFPHENGGVALQFAMAAVKARSDTALHNRIEQALFDWEPPGDRYDPKELPSPQTALRGALKSAGLSDGETMEFMRGVEVDRPRLYAVVTDEVRQAMAHGLFGPPGFVVDGVQIQGAMDVKTMTEFLNLVLSQRPPARPTPGHVVSTELK